MLQVKYYNINIHIEFIHESFPAKFSSLGIDAQRERERGREREREREREIVWEFLYFKFTGRSRDIPRFKSVF